MPDEEPKSLIVYVYRPVSARDRVLKGVIVREKASEVTGLSRSIMSIRRMTADDMARDIANTPVVHWTAWVAGTPFTPYVILSREDLGR